MTGGDLGILFRIADIPGQVRMNILELDDAVDMGTDEILAMTSCLVFGA
jgi:hypothetical protein